MTAPTVVARVKSGQIRSLLERAVRQGFTARPLGNNHLAIHRPCGTWACNVGTTISDQKAYLLIRSQLRRAGYVGR